MAIQRYVTYEELNRVEERLTNRIEALESSVREARSETTAVYNLAIVIKEGNDTINKRLDQMNERLVTPDDKIMSLDIHLAGLDKRLNHMETRLEGVETRLGNVEQRIETLSNDVAILKQQGQTQGELLKLIAQALNIAILPTL
jgi:chromosome segregation ATPase